MRGSIKLLIAALVSGALFVAPALADNGLLNIGGNQVNANLPICANVLSSGACQATGTQTAANTGGSSNNNGLVNVTGNQVNAQAPICANVISSASCQTTGTQTATNSGTGTTGNGGSLGNNGLVNVSGNQVNANLPICANVLSSGACQATGTQTTTNGGNPGTGGGCLTNCGGGTVTTTTGVGGGSLPQAIQEAAGMGGGVLPRTGSLGWITLMISLLGSLAAGAAVSRKLVIS
jgi:hypothetical protein